MFYNSKEKVKKVNNKFVKYSLYILARNDSGFDSHVVLMDLSQWRTVVSLIKNGSGIVSLKTANGNVDENKKIPQYVHFRSGRVHINNSFKKIGISYKIQPSLLLNNKWIMMIFMRTLGKIKNINGYIFEK